MHRVARIRSLCIHLWVIGWLLQQLMGGWWRNWIQTTTAVMGQTFLYQVRWTSAHGSQLNTQSADMFLSNSHFTSNVNIAFILTTQIKVPARQVQSHCGLWSVSVAPWHSIFSLSLNQFTKLIHLTAQGLHISHDGCWNWCFIFPPLSPPHRSSWI